MIFAHVAEENCESSTKPFVTYLREPASEVLEETRCIINNRAALEKGGDFVFVGFFGWQKPIVEHLIEQQMTSTTEKPYLVKPEEKLYAAAIERIKEIDDRLVSAFPAYEGIVAYLTTQKRIRKPLQQQASFPHLLKRNTPTTTLHS